MTGSTEMPTPIAAFFAAINARDAMAAGKFLTDDVTYQLLVPYPAIEGRDAVVAALQKSLSEADRVRWEVVGFAVANDVAFVERVDRFWFGDNEAAIECTGVFQLRKGLIAAVRDYADFATWRVRKEEAVKAT
ncbi:nuclear transport factor 2 family protein [Rhodococcus sp. CX]|uniref:nuclear transport factor 2 family protein n=1 Tax=Rhodococcus sp. CX TaxID=2789880 RepID=UPI0018CF6D99|nr:limonene-1,2-epoxide hydrolase family protein [Rhodococcus sp. CX]MBH0121087.1 nuclear transport factor 2 family protein [Rhodococcus sp. CX]